MRQPPSPSTVPSTSYAPRPSQSHPAPDAPPLWPVTLLLATIVMTSWGYFQDRADRDARARLEQQTLQDPPTEEEARLLLLREATPVYARYRSNWQVRTQSHS
jgi:hypothetical protein